MAVQKTGISMGNTSIVVVFLQTLVKLDKTYAKKNYSNAKHTWK